MLYVFVDQVILGSFHLSWTSSYIASHDSTPTGQGSHYFNINTITTQLNMVNSPVVQEDLKILTPG